MAFTVKPDIYVVELIGSGFLAVMAKPVAGEWIDDEFRGIANEGIKQIVSLLETHESYEVGLSREQDYAEKNAGAIFCPSPLFSFCGHHTH